MSPLLKVGQILKGAASAYTISKQLHSSVFIALHAAKNEVITKSVRGHWRLHNEAKVLRHFQTQTSSLRPLIEEIEHSDPPVIVLKYLDSDLIVESKAKKLTQLEIKAVAKTILEALRVLHEGGYVHTDIKSDNVLVSHGQETRFAEIKLGVCGGTVPADSKWPKGGYTIISLIHGDDWHMFDPSDDGVSFDDDEFEFTVLKKHHQFFGPFPMTYSEFADEDAVKLIIYAMETTPAEKRKPFHAITEREISKEDNVFLQKIMKLDPRDRPTAKEILEDAWFADAN